MNIAPMLRPDKSQQLTAPGGITPIIAGFHPDPSICHVNGTFYLANSSFEYSPGVPIWQSVDLVNWERVGHALTRDSQFSAGAVSASRGVFAPTLRYHDSRFWLITTNVDGGDGGQILVSATEPSGPWSEPTNFSTLNGIDPDLAWDSQGHALITYCGRVDGQVLILQAEVDIATGAALEEPRQLWSGTGLAHPEAPHLYQRHGWWYLLVAEGGTERGHAVSIARSKDPRGPFEGAPSNPIFSHRSLSHPVQNTGHADLVERPDGSWVMVYLGVRPRGMTPGFHVNGRETFLAGVTWRDDWPVIDEDAFEVPVVDGSFSDDFSATEPNGRFVSPGPRIADFATPHIAGGLLVHPVSPTRLPALVSTRCVDEYWTATATVDPAQGTAEMRVLIDDRHWYAVQTDAETVTARARIGGIEVDLGTIARNLPGPVDLVIRSVVSLSGGPDDLTLGVVEAGELKQLARLDGRYLSTEVAGGFTGRAWGVRAIDAPIRLLQMHLKKDS